MRDAPGVGLAAPQLGEALQACVIEVESQLHELVNPRIVRASGDDRDLEGCLSIPGYVAYVTRRERVWVVAQNRHGQKIKVAGTGLLARALQHELDHLDGKLYIDYLESMDELIAVGDGRRGRRRGPRGDERPGVTDEPGRRLAGADHLHRERRRSLSRRFGRSPRHPAVELVGVVTAPPRAAGREAAPSPTRRSHDTAADVGVARSCTPTRLRAPEAIAEVLGLRPGLVVLADYGQIVPSALLELPHGALNLHPSLLPASSRRDADPGGDPRRRSRRPVSP